MSKFLPQKPNAMLLRGRQVSVGEAVQLKGDTELREQIESELDRLIRERTREATLKAEAIVAKARQEVEAMLQAAQQEAAGMIQQAEVEQEAIRAAAHEAGFKAGYQEGYQEATEQVEGEAVELLHGAQTILQGAYQAEKRVLRTFEQQALNLVRHIASKVLRSELETAPEKILTMVEQAVESLHLSGKVKVVVSAELMQILRQYTAKTEQAVDAMSRLEFICDPQLELLQLYVISTEGSFNLSPEQQVAELTRPLEGNFELTLDDESDAVSLENESGSPSLEESAEPVREYVSLDDLLFDEADPNELDADNAEPS